jgi:hypothetical protein
MVIVTEMLANLINRYFNFISCVRLYNYQFAFYTR